MYKLIKVFTLSLFCLLITNLSYAASPIGNWKTIDDKTGQPKSILRIHGNANNLNGTVAKLLPGATTTTCTECSGNLKNKPILGMTVMWGLKQNPQNPNEWSGGTFLDPKDGKTYRAMITVSQDGKTITARGYIGVSLFGRNQTWYRVGG